MNTAGQRMLDRNRKPDVTSVAEWVGSRNFKRWTHILRFIDVKRKPKPAQGFKP